MKINEKQLMPNALTPEDELYRLQKEDTEGSRACLAETVLRVEWKNTSWYINQLYELSFLCVKHDLPDLAGAICKVSSLNGLKLPNGTKTFSEVILHKTMQENAPHVLARVLSLTPGHLPDIHQMNSLIASRNGMEMGKLVLDNWAQHQPDGKRTLPIEYATILLSMAASHSRVGLLKMVLAYCPDDRKMRSQALASSIENQSMKCARALISKASVCEALATIDATDAGIDDKLYDSLADAMHEQDILATNYLYGDQKDIPQIRARAEALQLNMSNQKIPLPPTRRSTRRL